jgi:sec-independent protein translocase protein TatB
MLDIFSPQHVLVLAAIALLVMGPADVPRLVRLMAHVLAKGRSVASNLRRNMDAMATTTELDGLRAEINALKRRYPLSRLEASLAPAPMKDRPFRG